MKKMRFTLGLMLSMLFLGANVANAQFVYGLPSNGSIAVTATVHPNGFYAYDVYVGSLSFETTVPAYPNQNWGYLGWMYFPANRTTPLTEGWLIPYGVGSYTGSDWYYNAAGAHVPGNAPDGNIFYWMNKSQTRLVNYFLIGLNYVNGNELKPAIFRTITIGEWKTQTSGSNRRNNLVPTDVKIYSQLNPEVGHPDNEIEYRPWMDRMTDVAEYRLFDDIFELLNKYVIYSIHYEVVMHDEVDSNMDLDPLGTLPDNYIGIQLAPEDGITTNPNHLSGAGPDLMFYVPKDNWTFKAFSKTPIMVTLEPLYESDAHKIIPDADKAVIINDNGDGSFDITIRRILFNYKIVISSVEPSSGDGDGDTTGNLTMGKNFVYAALGRLYVQTDSPSTLSVYSVTGQLVKQETVSGNTSLALPKGLYIVQLNGKAYKVIN